MQLGHLTPPPRSKTHKKINPRTRPFISRPQATTRFPWVRWRLNLCVTEGVVLCSAARCRGPARRHLPLPRAKQLQLPRGGHSGSQPMQVRLKAFLCSLLVSLSLSLSLPPVCLSVSLSLFFRSFSLTLHLSVCLLCFLFCLSSFPPLCALSCTRVRTKSTQTCTYTCMFVSMVIALGCSYVVGVYRCLLQLPGRGYTVAEQCIDPTDADIASLLNYLRIVRSNCSCEQKTVSTRVEGFSRW